MISYKIKILFIIFLGGLFLTSCGYDRTKPGLEYAPQMYVSKPYEPYTQVTKNTINPMGLNVRQPAKGTIPRRRFNTEFEITDSTGTKKVRDLMIYNLSRGDLELASKTLKNPIPATPEVLAEGEALYLRYCSHCHGKNGDGKGKVGKMYKGVPNYAAGAVQNLNGGHIFHVITHGKGRMWAHGSQVNPDERWKIVHYVHTLQHPEGEEKQAETKTEETPEVEVEKTPEVNQVEEAEAEETK